MKKTLIKRGDIFWVNFDPAKATEIQKTRPAIVCSHDILNENSSRIIVAPITSNLKKVYSFEYEIKNHAHLEGKIMLDQMRSIDKSRLEKKIGTLSLKEMQEIEVIIKFILGIQN
ncbi:MAG: type II toxin-antitoxin system PemK/MazF family toxin [Parachlamydiaceae bacterium]|nr:type II toxin-antitoxin system PemK/MazF family toxin [Parachlamydiaceae bacterium]